jgi:hypothetical protein
MVQEQGLGVLAHFGSAVSKHCELRVITQGVPLAMMDESVMAAIAFIQG